MMFGIPTKDEIKKIAGPDLVNDFVKIGVVAMLIGQQSQYLSFMLRDSSRSTYIGDGIRMKNIDSFNYHNILVHIDDVPMVVERYNNLFE